MATKQAENEKSVAISAVADDPWLDRAIRLTAVLLAATAVAMAGFWYFQSYVHTTVSVVDRDTAEVESQIRAQPSRPELRVAAANLYFEKGRLDAALVPAQQEQAAEAIRIHGQHLLGLDEGGVETSFLEIEVRRGHP